MTAYGLFSTFVLEQFTDTTAIVVTLTFLIFLTFYLVRKLHVTTRPRDDNSVSDRSTPAYTACSSPECVRCQRYNDVGLKALHNFNHYVLANANSASKLSRIKDSLEERAATPGGSIEWDNDLQQPNVFYTRGLTAKPFYHPSQSPLRSTVTEMEDHWLDVFDEFCVMYDNLCRGEFEGWHTNNTENGQWSVFSLINQGAKNKENCKKCPLTTKLLEKEANNIMSGCLFGNALFSVLYPGTHIDEHYGPTNVRLRCHLGLVVPPDCCMTVGKSSIGWIQGKCTLFDDSFLHSASNENNNGEFRAVLLVDLWHPDLCEEEKQAIEHIFSDS